MHNITFSHARFKVSILAATVVPTWLAFTNQRRVNVANDAVFRALQEAQRSAQKTKFSQSVSFKTDVTTKVPQIAFHLSSVPASSVSTDSWKPLGADLQLKPEKIWIGTNLNGSNTAVSSVSVVPSTVSTTTPPTITFNYVGALPGMGMVPPA